MAAPTLDPAEPVVPSAADILAARESAPRLVGALTHADDTVQLRL